MHYSVIQRLFFTSQVFKRQHRVEKMEVELGDVMKVVLQFLKEQGMTESFQILQRESGVHMNAVTDLDTLCRDIIAGRWDKALNQLMHIQVSVTTLVSDRNSATLVCSCAF